MKVLFNKALLKPHLEPFPESHPPPVVCEVGIEKKMFCPTESGESCLIHQHMSLKQCNLPFGCIQSGPLLCTLKCIAPCFWVIPKLFGPLADITELFFFPVSWESWWKQPCAIVPDARCWMWVMRLQGELCPALPDRAHQQECQVSLTTLLATAVQRSMTCPDAGRLWVGFLHECCPHVSDT